MQGRIFLFFLIPTLSVLFSFRSILTRKYTVSPFNSPLIIFADTYPPVFQINLILRTQSVIISYIVHYGTSYTISTQKVIITQLVYGIMGTTQKVMFQSQCVTHFMNEYLFYLFQLQRVRKFYVPCLRVIGSTLSKIPFLLQIQHAAENTDVTSNNLSGPGFTRSRPISIILS